MTRYERGFMKKCAEHGVDPKLVFNYAMEKRAWKYNENWLKNPVAGNSLLGAGAGALAGLAYGGLFGGERKDYLKRMLRTALYGALASGTATMLTKGAPNYLAQARKYIPKAQNWVKDQFK